ncbi:MAG: hypothetical protein GY714_14890 [Desulfobacterales bacterium]|nr:hypothetical protein [Desulfobacterales bacterium]MCP4164016.1 hypothetical protein [Deltaproteobacteria bacterium]
MGTKQLILIEKSILIDRKGNTYDDKNAPFPEIQIAKYTLDGNKSGHKKAKQIISFVLGSKVMDIKRGRV